MVNTHYSFRRPRHPLLDTEIHNYRVRKNIFLLYCHILLTRLSPFTSAAIPRFYFFYLEQNFTV